MSWILSKKFLKCDCLLVGRNYQISGFNHIKIKKMSAGNNFRMEAISFWNDEEISSEIEIGSNVSFGHNVHIGCVSKITFGDNVLCGSNITILDHDHGCYSGLCSTHSDSRTAPSDRSLISSSITIGNNVHIGEYVVILKGVKIGSGVVVGAGSVVTKSLPCDCVAVGNPAKIIKRFNFNKCCWLP